MNSQNQPIEPPISSNHPATKKVRILLAALTRVEYTEILEVPQAMSPDDLNRLVQSRYDAVDGGLYTDDAEYWERSPTCRWEAEASDAKVDGTVLLGKDGVAIVTACDEH